MDQKYADIVRKDIDRRRESALTYAVTGSVFYHLTEDTPLAFPAALAEGYLINNYKGLGAECQDCRFKLPFEITMCPVCSGPVESTANYRSRLNLLRYKNT
jgi:hypothetical protein